MRRRTTVERMNAARAVPSPRRSSLVPAVPELVLAACLVGLALFTALVADSDKVAGARAPATWWEWALVVSPAVPVAFRRVAPLAATPVTVTGQLVLWGMGLATAFFPPLVMIYTVCAEAGERGRRLGAASGVALCAMALLGVFVAPDVTFDLFVFTGLASAMAYLLGVHAAQARTAEVTLAEELAVARVERDIAHERAAANERQRIARELHDIVGHSLSIIAVRAEAADRVAPKNPNAAVDAVGAIASTARSALADVRRVLAGFRDESAQAELAPVPSIATIPALVDSFAEAGVAITLDGELPIDEQVGAAVAAGTYRIVQEALTNVLKHGGPAASVVLRLELLNDSLHLCIDDSGRGAATVDNGDGLGLTGMRERAEVLGGTFESGPLPGGGYSVVATLPVDPSNDVGSGSIGSGSAASGNSVSP